MRDPDHPVRTAIDADKLKREILEHVQVDRHRQRIAERTVPRPIRQRDHAVATRQLELEFMAITGHHHGRAGARQVLPCARAPMVVTSDCHELKLELARRYGMIALPHRSQHGAFGNALPVAIDLNMLKNSRFNYHINCRADWWSGFSHYTSMIFRVPSMNFRSPHFAKEEITAQGQLVAPRRWWPTFKRA